MLFTVAICTWNRASLLRQTLDRFRQMQTSGFDWELIVVDNCCTDNTREVVASFSEALPIRLIVESQPGQSRARNAATTAARGEFIAWTDDDVLVSEQWLESYRQSAEACPSCDFFGGPIRPWFEVTPPVWVTANWDRLSSVYATRDLGVEAIALDSHRIPYGANYVTRTSVQRRFPYDAALGLTGKGQVRGEEVAVLRAMLKAGHRGVWVPGASVEHFVPAARLTPRYVKRFFVGQGMVLPEATAAEGTPLLFGRPRWRWRAAIEAEIRYRVARATRGSDTWVPHLVHAGLAWGLARGLPKVHLDEKAPVVSQ